MPSYEAAPLLPRPPPIPKDRGRPRRRHSLTKPTPRRTSFLPCTNPKTQDSTPTRNLGKTGFKVGIFSLGGQSAIEQPNNWDVGVNLIDTAHNPYSFTAHSPPAVEKQMGIIGMKIAGRGRILASWTPPPVEQQQRSWEGVVTTTRPGTLNVRNAMCYTLSLPLSTVIVGCDNIAQLEENVQIAREFTPLSQAQMAALGNQVAPVARQTLCSCVLALRNP